MSIIRIHSLSDPGVDIFSVLTEAQLRNRLEPEKGIFIAESPKVIQVALDKGYEPLALLCEERHSRAMQQTSSVAAATCPSIPASAGCSEH